MAGLKQGMKLKENFKNIIAQAFSANRKEGFSGILGSNPDMDNVIASDTANTSEKSTKFNNNIAQYGTDYAALQKRTELYLNDSENNYSLKKNYNVFINKSLNQSEINETIQMGCVAKQSMNGLQSAAGFNSAYPRNFTNYSDAESACKLWAADSGSSVYALSRNPIGKFKCYTGSTIPSALDQYTKPATIYNVADGDANVLKGGLFANGQIGVYSPSALPKWNISNMSVPKLMKKYNSNDYSNGPQAVVGTWWGFPSQGGWGENVWPNDKTAWWLSTADHMYVGTMGYFYYTYNSPVAKQIVIYAIVDDVCVLKINGNVITENGPHGAGGHVFLVNLVVGKNVFEFKLINTGGPGAFVFYAADYPNWQNILFTSSSTGWGYTNEPPSDYNLINNSDAKQSNPYTITTINTIPTAYTKCDPFFGGAINKNSLIATYGRNCSNDVQPPLNIRYVHVGANSRGDWLQIAQIAVNTLVNGALVNVAPNGRASAPNIYPNARAAYANDGTLSPRPYPYIYHSGSASPNNHWLLDLGKNYPVSQIIYYNRSDCCSERAIGMNILLTDEAGVSYGPITLNGGARQAFNVSPNSITVAA
jgi:hypothetical protein